jgi:hypothetical protein
MTFFRSCFSFIFVFACFCLFWLQAEERGKWDVSSAGTFKPGDEALGLYICHDRKSGRMQYEETNKPAQHREKKDGFMGTKQRGYLEHSRSL